MDVCLCQALAERVMLRACQCQEADGEKASPALLSALCQRLGRLVQVEEEEAKKEEKWGEGEEEPLARIKCGYPIKWGICPSPILFMDLKRVSYHSQRMPWL